MKRLSTILPFIPVVIGLVAFQVITSLAGRDYYLTQMIMAAYYAIVVMGLCLVMGYAGQVSLGHGAFFALGGYTSAVLTTHDFSAAAPGCLKVLGTLRLVAARSDLYGNQILTFNPWAAFVLGLLLTLGVALLVGYPALRLKGHYLAMATLGFGLIIYRLLLANEITGGADGITGVPAWEMAPGLTVSGRRAYRVVNFYLAWGLGLGVLLLLGNVVRSRPGRALRAIHEGELAANAMGVNTAGYKLRTFVLSALLAAGAGSLLTHYSGGIGPSEAGAMKSVRYVALVAAGGMGNLWGVLIVSTLLNFLSLRGCFGSFDHAVFGAILIVIVSLAPQGPFKPVAQWIAGLRRSFTKERSPAHGAARRS